MKNILMAIAIACVAMGVNACGSQTTVTDSGAAVTTEATEQKTKKDTYALNETATFDKIKITALEMKESKGKQFFEPADGKVFVGVKFEMENISEETQNMSSLLLFDAYCDDIKCDYSLSANVVFGDGTLDGEVAAGKKLVGWYSVEVPQDWQEIELEVKQEWLSKDSAKFIFAK